MARWIGYDHAEAVLGAADAWREQCFVADGSLFGEEALWTLENVRDLKERFLGNPIEGADRTFFRDARGLELILSSAENADRGRVPRKPQGSKPRGSQRWLQVAVNSCPSTIDSAIRNTGICLDEPIVWTSPLDSDDFAEYMDAAFLHRLGVRLEYRSLGDFWPRSGPRWDALARSGDSVLLIEAKANIRELNSSPCDAQPKSLARIRKALKETRAFLNVKSDTDWTRCFYQYANRLAHLYLLRELNGCDAFLVFLYFVDDHTTTPASQSAWHGAVALAEAHLGLPKSEWMSRYVKDVYIDTADLSHVDWPP